MSEKNDAIDTKDKKRMFKIIIFLSIIMVFIGVFLASYYSSINKAYDSYETVLVNGINGINEINKNVSQFNSNDIIDTDFAKEQLPIIIKDLSTIREELNNSQPTSKYKKNYENLRLGLDKNLLIYRQIVGILNNPTGKDVESSTESLKAYRNDCMNYYALVDMNNIKITLPETCLRLIDNVLNYSYSAIKIRKETEIKSTQNLEFIKKIDGLSSSFLTTKTDFYSYVAKARNKQMSYDDILSLVDENFSKLNDIQNNFKSLSIPSSAIPVYESFKTLITKYDEYLKDFKYCLVNEKVQSLNTTSTPAELDSLYVSSKTKFSDMELCYNNFIKIYTELKSK